MNYDNLHPTFSFRIEKYQDQKITKLATQNQKSRTEFAKDIITKYLKGELIEKSEDFQTELIKLKIEKLKAEIKYAQIKNNYFETFNQPMTRRAEIAIKPQIIEQKQVFQHPQSPYDASNKRLQCIDCGSLFCWDSEKNFNEQMAEFQRHLVSKHNRVKTEIERQVLIDLKYEGDST
jgi:hypothetical protein